MVQSCAASFHGKGTHIETRVKQGGGKDNQPVPHKTFLFTETFIPQNTITNIIIHLLRHDPVGGFVGVSVVT